MVESINGTTPLEEARAAIKEAYDLTYTRAVAKVTQQVYDRVKSASPRPNGARSLRSSFTSTG
jgi:quinolinate synthase